VKTDYTLFDNAIVSHVREGKNTFTQLSAGRLCEFADKLAGVSQGWRLIDRRLQALRKAGKLSYDRKAGWTVASPPVGQERQGRG